MSERGEEWMAVGHAAGVFGLRGELKVEPLTDFPERFAPGAELRIGPERRSYVIERARPHRGLILLKLQHVDDADAAEELRGSELSVPRDEAVTLPEGHYFLADLVGIEVETTDGRHLGTVSEVLRTGSNDVYVIGSGRQAVLVPGIQDAVAELDVAGRRLVVEPWVLEAGE